MFGAREAALAWSGEQSGVIVNLCCEIRALFLRSYDYSFGYEYRKASLYCILSIDPVREKVQRLRPDTPKNASLSFSQLIESTL